MIPDDLLLLRRRDAALVAEVLHRLLDAGESLAVLQADGSGRGASRRIRRLGG